ncbi:class I SAM-dependent methyltransferase [Bizionia argentinensis JUB59]|uniref:Class I SAM-dependent methyltransferase n=1 Tax=Bizionia argentinensis JUB59 TaxID=1046627 RepID=G2EEB1_9FLAO|nr:class I SAM-dependent methyltransferase [Bizionia argentinensis JUB59]
MEIDIKKVDFKVEDYSVSNESFQLKQHSKFEILETNPQPNLEDLPAYYKSEDYISHTDSRRNLFEKAYHVIRSIALKRKLKLINSYVDSDSKKNILDIGCGTGDFLQTALGHNWCVSGIEPNPEARKIANAKTENAVLDARELINLKNKSFDVITLWHVLEHLPDLNEQISNYKELLKNSGTLIIAVPNYKSYDAEFYQNFWAAYDVPRHLWHFSQTGMKQLLAIHGLEVVEIKPMIFDSYYVSLLSEKYKTGKMNFFKAFQQGFKSNRLAKRSGEYSSLIYVIKKQ